MKIALCKKAEKVPQGENWLFEKKAELRIGGELNRLKQRVKKLEEKLENSNLSKGIVKG